MSSSSSSGGSSVSGGSWSSPYSITLSPEVEDFIEAHMAKLKTYVIQLISTYLDIQLKEMSTKLSVEVIDRTDLIYQALYKEIEELVNKGFQGLLVKKPRV